MHGTLDPAVGFIDGLAFYNALRYNGKKALFQKIVTGPNWMAFGFIGAEAELARMR